MRLKILSWNIWGGQYLDEVVDFLKATNADIIALQEVIEEESGNTAKTIAERLGYEYALAIKMEMPAIFMPEPRRSGGSNIKFGNAVLSRHKIVNSQAHELSPEESRVALQADIQIANATLHVFSIHLKHNHQQPLPLQDAQADKLASLLPADKTVVLGDFNALPESYAVKKMGQILRDAESGSPQPTWSVYRDGCTICQLAEVKHKLDYIFLSKDIKSLSYEVGGSNGSDHLPVSAVVEI